MRNYRPAFVEGTANVRASTFKDHAATDMHRRAMALEAKESARSVMEYAPIARTMAQANLSEAAKLSLKKKFDIAYISAACSMLRSMQHASSMLRMLLGVAEQILVLTGHF